DRSDRVAASVERAAPRLRTRRLNGGGFAVPQLRPTDQDGRVLAEQRLGVQMAGAFVARWDLRHSQLLILRGASAGGVDVMLLRFGSDDFPVADNEAGAPEPAL